MGIRLAIFDMAGTTVEDNQHVASALQQALAHYGFNVRMAVINEVMGYAKPVAIAKLLEKFDITDDVKLIDRVHRNFESEMVAFYKNNEQIKEKPNALLVFDALRSRDIRVAIDTGFSRPIANVIFERLGWKQGHHFDWSITSDEVENGRPYPDMIFKAMAYFGIKDPMEVAKVGDTASDMQQGKAAGCGYVVGVTTGAYSRAALSKEPHTHLIADLKELLLVFKVEQKETINP